MIAAPRHVSLAKRAPHPHAGRLFIDFVLSPEGQGIIASSGRVVVRPGVNLVVPRLVKGLKLHPIRPDMAKDFPEISKLYYSIVK